MNRPGRGPQSAHTAGFTLVEALCALAILGIALAATLSINTAYIRSQRFTEERRIALQAAVEKVEELRRKLASGLSLDEIYDLYKPLIGATDPANMPAAAFRVPGLATQSADPIRSEYVGTISLIIDETPSESDYGVDYSVSPSLLKLGADINGNRYYNDMYPSAPPSPFPLDLNANNTTTDNPMSEGFYILPVVVTVHWQGVYGSQRIDLFTILFADRRI